MFEHRAWWFGWVALSAYALTWILMLTFAPETFPIIVVCGPIAYLLHENERNQS